MWNNAIGMYAFIMISFFFCLNDSFFRGKSTHPGVVVDLCQNPDDPTRVRIFQANQIITIFKFQLYIGFSTHLSMPNSNPIGHVVCWNLQQKTSESVYTLQHVR
jgi:hypothetical protein